MHPNEDYQLVNKLGASRNYESKNSVYESMVKKMLAVQLSPTVPIEKCASINLST